MVQNNDIRETINAMRNIQEAVRRKMQLNEDESAYAETSDAIPYTDSDELLTSIKSTCKTQFGADFSKIKSPMLYYPQNDNVILNGEISSMNNAKFQFEYKSDNKGCSLWVDPLQLDDKILNKLKIIYGVYNNWCNELDSTEDKKPLNYRAQ